MAYAEKVPSPKGDYWRGRYKGPEGQYLTVLGDDLRPARFETRKEAKQAGDDAESDVRNKRWKNPKAGDILFADWAEEWYDSYDLADSTHANRRRHLENHLLPFFGETALREIDAALILKWKRREKAEGNKEGSIRTWHGTLHLILEDAVPLHIPENPAARKRGRGKRSGRKAGASRGPERVITSPLGVLLIGERMSILTGRDQEFIMAETLFCEALRLGECVGLEKQHIRPRNKPGTLRVEWQLHEIDGRLVRCPPKDDSYGNPELPPFLLALLDGHLQQNPPGRCPCHGQTYAFRGMGTQAPRWNRPLRELAEHLGVSLSVVQSAMGGRGRIGAQARGRVLEAAGKLATGRRRTQGSRRGTGAGPHSSPCSPPPPRAGSRLRRPSPAARCR